MLIYATPDDLATYNRDIDMSCVTNIDSLLRSASLRIGEAIGGALYNADDTGLPTDATLIQALSDATCAQASAWIALNVDPSAGGITKAGVLQSVGIGSGRKVFADAQAAADARTSSVDSLVPDAVLILRNAGLIQTGVWTFG